MKGGELHMYIKTTELEDNKFVGYGICEIISVPLADTIHAEVAQAMAINTDCFFQLLSEFHRLSMLGSSAIELIWISEPAVNQVYKAQIRLFAIFREISENTIELKNQIETIQKSFVAQLSALSYTIEMIKIDDRDFMLALKNINCSDIYALVKSEKCIVNSNTPFPYYYCDLLDNDNDNFRSILETLSRYEGAAISFQLFPTNFSVEEGYMINEMAAGLSKVIGGFPTLQATVYRDSMAQTPFDYYNYYLENVRQPLFTYNILILATIHPLQI